MSLHKTKGLLIDCDGTIAVDAELHHGEVVRQTLRAIHEAAAVDFSTEYYDQIWLSQLGGGIKNFYNVYATGLNGHATQVLEICPTPDDFVGRYESHYINAASTGEISLLVRRGFGDLIASAKELGVATAVISNANQTVLETTLNAIQIPKPDLILGMDTVIRRGYEPKPKPGSYILGTRLLDVDPKDCIGFEDTFGGIQSLVSAGVGSIVYCHNSDVPLAPDHKNPEIAKKHGFILKHADVILGQDECVHDAVIRMIEEKDEPSGIGGGSPLHIPQRTWSPF